MEMKFSQKIAAITGGGQGIGRGFGVALAKQGAAVAIYDVNPQKGEATAREIRDRGGTALFVPCDVADEHQVAAAVGETVQRLGGVDILINCAAKHLMEYNQPCTELSRDKWRLMLDVNVIGIVNCADAVRETMKQRGGGVIVNISSITGFMSTGAYGISKLAVRGLTVALAHELASANIRVCGIAPGLVNSDNAMSDVPKATIDYVLNQQLIKRPGRIEDLTNALCYLCSDEASWVTGETLIVSGGYKWPALRL
jgi:3-oxoacyl-[acyl-carrier protein] reductase